MNWKGATVLFGRAKANGSERSRFDREGIPATYGCADQANPKGSWKQLQNASLASAHGTVTNRL